MLRLCMIGNSHVACMKLGWDDIRQRHSDVDVTFFGARNSAWSDEPSSSLMVEAGLLAPVGEDLRAGFVMTSGGESAIDPARFDAFVICGLQLNVRHALNLAQDYWPATFAGLGGERVVSEAAFKTRLAASYERTPAIAIARMLRTLSDGRIVLFPQPMPSERANRINTQPGIRENADLLATLMRNSLATATQGIADVVWQPDETLAQPICTRHEFCVGAMRLRPDEAHSENNHNHMNARFGALAMEHVLTRLV